MVKLEAYSVSLLGEIKYIGITIQGIRVRWLSHCSAARNSKNRALPRAIRKYGPKAFVVEHIASAKTREDLMALEVLLIKQWNTLAPQGYNLTGGGDGCFAPSDETRRKISISGTGRKPNGTTRQKMSAWQIGKLHVSGNQGENTPRQIRQYSLARKSIETKRNSEKLPGVNS